MNGQAKLSRRLGRKIDSLRKRESSFFNRRDRFWAHRYLACVYAALQNLTNDELDTLSDGECGDEMDAAKNLILMTSKADLKTVSRWIQALNYVHGIIEERGGNVETLLRQLGGISGCARAEANPRAAAGERRRDWR